VNGTPRPASLAEQDPTIPIQEPAQNLTQPSTQMVQPRPVPSIGDQTSAADRAAEPSGWAFSETDRASLYAIIEARRDIRRFRPDPIPEATLLRVLSAAHAAPSVGHSQPWRFIVVSNPATREKAGWIADRERLLQADLLEPEAARQLLDLQLEGIREAPVGIVVCCDRRVTATGVLGRATFQDSDLWSSACAIENLWLAARSEGLGVGWVTLFPPNELAELVGLPEGIDSLGWLCIGWPDERPPEPGLERAGWSRKLPLSEVLLRESWDSKTLSAPVSRLRAPDQHDIVEARDQADVLLTPQGSLGVLDRAVDKALANGYRHGDRATLVLVGGDHPVADLGVTAFKRSVTADVLAAALLGQSVGTALARASGFETIVIDAGSSTGDLVHADALSHDLVRELIDRGYETGTTASAKGFVILGEVGMGNTTVAAVLTASLLDLPASVVVGRGSSSDSAMVERKRSVLHEALSRAGALHGEALGDPVTKLAALGGPEFAYLVGVILGAANAKQTVILDGLATSVCALLACQIEPGVQGHLVAGQRSRETIHQRVLYALGLEPLLDLRMRAGEGAGAVLAAQSLVTALTARTLTARTAH
jgi:nicotinate-nucleotide--dimethylbenzimidazole phosphoribosyltransferase